MRKSPDASEKRVPAYFFQTEAGGEPVRDWLKSNRLSIGDRRLIGEDIKTVEKGWPIGMPVCRPMSGGLHEVRTNLPGNRIARFILRGCQGAYGVATRLYQEDADHA